MFFKLAEIAESMSIGVAKAGQSLVAISGRTIDAKTNKGVEVCISDVLFIPELRDNLLTIPAKIGTEGSAFM